jgi:hypothetical protein
VDKFNDLFVSCYTTAGHARLLLLHDSRLSEESIRLFFQDAHELYIKASTRHATFTPLTRSLAPGGAEPVPQSDIAR